MAMERFDELPPDELRAQWEAGKARGIDDLVTEAQAMADAAMAAIAATPHE